MRGGTVLYRIKGSTATAATRITAIAKGVSLTDVRLTEDRGFEVDLAPAQAIALAGTADKLEISADLASGHVTKRAGLGLAIKKLGITAGDAYDKWPRPACDAPVEACLRALPDGTVDLASCGEAIVVQACAGQVGVFVDDVAFQAALADAFAETGSPAFRSDATGLVGADRLEAFVGGAEQTAEARLEQMFGRWYLSEAARTAALAAAVDAGLLYAVARPIDLVEPVSPVPGNDAAVRHIAADALLGALVTFDFEGSEYGRSLVQLVSEFRAGHVASIREFRETVAIEPHPGQPGRDVLVGRWLDAHVEVSVDRATGAAADVYIEID